VPEAYLLVRQFGATRPGLLVIDADGRFVASSRLLGSKPEEVAKWLSTAARASPTERFVIEIDDAAARTRLLATAGVSKVAETETRLTLDVAPGLLHPKKIPGQLIHPVAVAGAKPDRPGVWYPGFAGRLLLHPQLTGTDVLELRTFEFDAFPKGGRGAVVAAAPLRVAGVVSVFPDIFFDQQVVVIAAFTRAGCKPARK